jgi:hypothetical protein
LHHFDVGTYPFGGHHATEIGATVREVLGVGGGAPTMPRNAPGAVKGAELEAVVVWSRAFDQAHAAGLHHHGAPGAHEHGDQQNGGDGRQEGRRPPRERPHLHGGH